MEIRSLAGTGLGMLCEAFSQAFADYGINSDREALYRMLKRRGFVAELSFAAFDDDCIAAFTFNGIGTHAGLPTAYDTGTGTLPDYRGQGLASRIFTASIPHLQAAGIRQYLLEVLQHNPAAITVYRKIGFEETREFNYFAQTKLAIRIPEKNPDFPHTILPATPDTLLRHADFLDFRPSWQNDGDSIVRAGTDLIGLGLYRNDDLLGYCICEPASGDIAQLAVHPRFRRQGVGTALFRHALENIEAATVKIINTEIDSEPVTQFLRSMNIPVKGRQFEMARKL